MPVPLGHKFRPAPKWGVTDEQYDCWILNMLQQWPAYTYEYNSYIFSKVKADVLMNIVPPEEVTKRRSERKAGVWARKSGLDPDDRRPDYFRSLSTYGDLFFGSSQGFHREFKPKKGRKFSLRGDFVIMLSAGEEMTYGGHPYCRGLGHQFFYNALTAAYALVEEAEHRGDAISLLVQPGEVDRFIPGHAKPAKRRAPHIRIRWRSHDGAHEFNEDLFETWIGRSGESNPSPPPDGVLPADWVIEALRRVGPPRPSSGSPELSKYYFWMNSFNYDEIKDELLKFYWPKSGHGYRTTDMDSIPAIHSLLRGRRDRRGTFILLTSLGWICWFMGSFHYYREIYKTLDMFVFDVGDRDWSLVFKRDPYFRDLAGRPLFKYVNINTLFSFGLNPGALIGFSELRVSVDKPRALVITLNNITREFPFTTFPTAGHIERAVKKAFPTLMVERLTSANYQMRQANDRNETIRVPDGVVTLTGYDVPNMTYKIMKTIGGTIDGVKVT